MKRRLHCFRCGQVKWSAAKKPPKCDECRREMDYVSNDHCNVCGRELINEQEDRIGLCAACG